MMKETPREYKDWKDLNQEIKRTSNVLIDPPPDGIWSRSRGNRHWFSSNKVWLVIIINLTYSVLVVPISLIASIYSHRLNLKKWSLIKKIIELER